MALAGFAIAPPVGGAVSGIAAAAALWAASGLATRRDREARAATAT